MGSDGRVAAGRMTKFSAQPRSAEQDAMRARNNQRRHRAKVKGYISELQAQLAEKTTQLEDALAQVDHLANEVELLRRCVAMKHLAYPSSDPSVPDGTVNSLPHPLPSSSNSQGTGVSSTLSGQAILKAAAPSTSEAVTPGDPDASSPKIATYVADGLDSAMQEEPAVPYCRDTALNDEPYPAGEVDGVPSDILTAMMSGKNCESLPASYSGESTTPCLDAYRVINQQNFSGLGVTAITNWLKPGFRKAAKQGGACRVNTQLLFALLDQISESCQLRPY